MLLFGHVGLTLAAGILAKNVPNKGLVFATRRTETVASHRFSHLHQREDRAPNHRVSILSLLGDCRDYRLLLIGSLLPDLIDKPIGGVFFFSTFQNSRIFAHTLCLNLLAAALGVYLYKRRRNSWLISLSFGSMMHLILDQMWLSPETLLWPAYGFSFPKLDSADFFGWLPKMLYVLRTDASVYVPEIVGLTITTWFLSKLIRKKQGHAFIRNGTAA